MERKRAHNEERLTCNNTKLKILINPLKKDKQMAQNHDHYRHTQNKNKKKPATTTTTTSIKTKIKTTTTATRTAIRAWNIQA